MDYILIILPFVLIGLALWFVHSRYNLILNADNLVRQPLFWASIVAPLALFLYFGFFSWSGHNPQLDSNGLTNFYNISKIPLLFLASSVPLAAMVSNLHRTIQTETQIIETKKKNISDLYYSHFKFYTESFSKVPTYKLELSNLKKEVHLSHHFNLYRLIFPNYNPTENATTEVNHNYFDDLFSLWDNVNELLKQHNSEYNNYLKNKNSYNFPNLPEIINKIEITVISICKKLAISGYHYPQSAIYFYGPSSINPPANIVLHSSFFNHKDMCETIESIANIYSRLVDIINPTIRNQIKIPTDGPLDKQVWLNFKLFTSLDQVKHSFSMEYNEPTFLP
ncbi:hypothetical protein UYSO10_4927 [Kosakonia radicincitans]|uniref:hypothetical protein n=1 Tax=Kosakonia radicincitans TaxID=283686 RepID=UPI0011841AFE|nr:hypothetical protein [Kosakonia radicincitans]VVT53868.1 hypothetical protein UYSO10_4927 [Kosakonia radicincitans]